MVKYSDSLRKVFELDSSMFNSSKCPNIELNSTNSSNPDYQYHRSGTRYFISMILNFNIDYVRIHDILKRWFTYSHDTQVTCPGNPSSLSLTYKIHYAECTDTHLIVEPGIQKQNEKSSNKNIPEIPKL